MRNFVKRQWRKAREADSAKVRPAKNPRHSVRGQRPMDPELHLSPPFSLKANGPR